MLKRTRIRKYLLAMLYSESIPQNADCETGPIFVNCDGNGPDVNDSYVHQLYEDAEGSYNLNPDSVGIVFNIGQVEYSLGQGAVNDVSIPVTVDIVAHGSSGAIRANMLDLVEERLLYRMVSNTTIKDYTTGDTIRSVINSNNMSISSSDQTSFDGNYTIRSFSFTVETGECIKEMGCDDVPICFDFSNLGFCND